MVGFLKSIFRNKSQKDATPPSLPDVSGLTFEQMLSHAQSLPANTPVRHIVTMVQRLYEIALYDHHVSQHDRQRAMQLVDGLKQDVEAALANNPDQLDTFRKANALTLENAGRFGIGSLSWKLTEENISNADTVPYVMRREHGALVADLLQTMQPAALASIKSHLVRQLVLARLYNGVWNTVLTLHALATQSDKAALAVFTPAEIAIFTNVPNYYDAARQILVELGLLPPISSSPPLTTMNSSTALQTILFAMKDRGVATENDGRLSGLKEEHQLAITTTLLALRIHLSRCTLAQYWGPQCGDDFLSIFGETATEGLRYFERLSEILTVMPVGTPIDFMLVIEMMAFGGLDPKTEDDYKRDQSIISMAAAWIGEERAQFLDQIRFLLRRTSSNQLSKGEAVEDWIDAIEPHSHVASRA
jgi:hypothetical protein